MICTAPVGQPEYSTQESTMPMRYDAYYLCRAKPTLLEESHFEDDRLHSLFADSLLFENSEGDRMAWSGNERLAWAKLLIIAYFKGISDDPFFATAPISVEFYDRWWALERFPGPDDELSSIAEGLSPHLINCFEPTGLPHVDALIHDLKRGDRYNAPKKVFGPTKHMVLWGDCLVGYLENAYWEVPLLIGRWRPIHNATASEFLQRLEAGQDAEVRVANGPGLNGPALIDGERITIRITFAT